MSKKIAIVLVTLTLACGIFSPEETRIVECTRRIEELVGYCPGLRQARDDGWTCRYDGTIRNAFGGSIGTRYVCTK